MKVLLSLYKKSKLGFAIGWIIVYCVLMSVGDGLSTELGVEKSVTLSIALVMSAVLLAFLFKNKLPENYGLCKPRVPARKVLFYFPLLILMTVNLMNGFSLNLSFTEVILYVLTMFCVGFLEEIIFRGLLFNAMAENNVKSAIAVSSVTFGIGHIINLFNGSEAELVANLLQVIYAMAAGYMFVMLYYKTQSLVPCIVTHGLFNALGVFSDDTTLTIGKRLFSCVFLVLVSGGYALFLSLRIKTEDKDVPVKKATLIKNNNKIKL